MVNNYNPLEEYKEIIALPPEERVAYLSEHEITDFETMIIHTALLISAIKESIQKNKNQSQD